MPLASRLVLAPQAPIKFSSSTSDSSASYTSPNWCQVGLSTSIPLFLQLAVTIGFTWVGPHLHPRPCQSATLGNRLVRLYMHELAVVIHSQFLSLNELHVLDHAVAATRVRLSQSKDESQQMKRGWDVDAWCRQDVKIVQIKRVVKLRGDEWSDRMIVEAKNKKGLPRSKTCWIKSRTFRVKMGLTVGLKGELHRLPFSLPLTHWLMRSATPTFKPSASWHRKPEY